MSASVPAAAPDAAAGAPASTASLFRAALIALWQEDLATAETHLRAAIEANPGEASSHAYLGAVLLATGRPDDAILATDFALSLQPDGFAPQMKAGELWFRLGDPDRAAELFLGALRAASPGSPEAQAASRARAAARRAVARSIPHGAVLPRWLALRLPGATAAVEASGERNRMRRGGSIDDGRHDAAGSH